MATPFFVAEAPTVTILRSLASSAYGSYTLNLPDGIELEDVTDLDAPGNILGYVARLQRGKRVGGLARSFIRADVAVTAADPSDPDVVPESDVHDVLDEARSRVSSDFFLESDITKAGMGAWIPYVDFNVGDRANISVLDHVVNLPITRIESQVTDHSDTDFLVHVGGQLVSDEQARLAENMTLEKKFLQDRRELAGLEGVAKKAQKTADGAQASANDAQETADGAVVETTNLRDALAGEGASSETLNDQLIALNQQLQEAGEAPEGATFLGLLPAYMEANTRRWELQEQVDQMQDDFASSLQEQIAQAKQDLLDSQRGKIQRIIATTSGTSHPDVPVIPRADGRYQIEPPNTEGALVILEFWTESGSDLTLARKMRIQDPNGAIAIIASGETVIGEWAQIPGQLKSISVNETGIKRIPSSSTWYRAAGIWTIGPSGTKNFDLSGSLRFRRAWGFYRVQVRAGSEILFDKEYRGSSSITSYVNYRVHFTVKSLELAPGTEVSVRVMRWDNGPFPDAETYDNLVVNGSWVETT